MTVELKNITPEAAKEILAKNPFNRELKDHVVDELAYLIKSGHDIENKRVILDKRENLFDGQHRLNAIIRADKEYQLLIIKGASVKQCWALQNNQFPHLTNRSNEGFNSRVRG